MAMLPVGGGEPVKLLNASSNHAVMYSALQSCKYTVVVLVPGGARMSARKSSSDVKLPKIHWLKDSRLPGKWRALARVLDRTNFAWLSDVGLFFRIYKLRFFFCPSWPFFIVAIRFMSICAQRCH